MLEGIARIEGEAYTLLRDLGAARLTSVLTAGGGASNDTWTRIRSRTLGVQVSSSPHGVPRPFLIQCMLITCTGA